MDTKSETDLDRQIELQVERVAKLEAEFNEPLCMGKISRTIELTSAKATLDILRSHRIDELIRECEKIELELMVMQRSRLEICDGRLLRKYDEREVVKQKLAQVQLDQIEAAR